MSSLAEPPAEPSLAEIAERMRMAVKRHTRKAGPLYLQLADVIQQAVDEGNLKPGAKMPTERALSNDTGVSRRTIAAAYDTARQAKVLVSRQGSGTWVRDAQAHAGAGLRGSASVSRVFSEADAVIPFTMAKLAALPMVQDAIMALTKEEVANVLSGKGYATLGLAELRREIAAHYTRIGLPTTEDEIIVTTGAQQALSLAVSLLVPRGGKVVIEDPSYSGAIDAFRWWGCEILPVAFGARGMDLDQLRDVMQRERPDLLYVMSVHNPTGIFMPEDVQRGIAGIAAEFGVPIVEDLALSHITLGRSPPRPLSAIGTGATVLEVDSVSKILWGGLRVGWIRASRTDIQRLGRLKAVADLGSPLMSQLVAARLMPKLSEASLYVQRTVTPRLARLTRRISEHLPSWKWTEPEGGFSLWVEMPNEVAMDFAIVAQRHGVAVVPGPTLSASGHFENRLRLPFVLPDDLIDEGVRRLSDAWSVHRQSVDRNLGHTIFV